MIPLLRSWTRRTDSVATATRPRRTRRHRPEVDALEGRQLLTLGTIPFQVNLFSTNLQSTAAVATAPDGRSVAVWSERAPFNSNQSNIRGRLIGADGVPIGSDLLIANTPLDEADPAVAINSQGEFVVTWTRREAGNHLDIRAQRFTASGVKVGGAILVSSLSDGSSINEDSDVAMGQNGSFIVSYTREGTESISEFNTDVVVQKYNSSGTLIRTSLINSEFFEESESSIGVDPAGRFTVAFTSAHLNSISVPETPDVRMQRFTAAGSKNGAVIAVASSAVEERDPDVAVDAFGNLVVAYQKFVNGTIEIKAKRMTGSVAASGEINISNDPTFFAFDPEVAVNPITGAFVVAYGRVTESGLFRAQTVEVSASNTVIARFSFADGDDDPHVSMDSQGNYLVTFTRQVGMDKNIFARRGHRPN